MTIRGTRVARWALASASLLALATSASAQVYKAPAYSAPAYNWSGFYVGLNVGGVWGRSDMSNNVDCSPQTLPAFGFLCNPNLPGIFTAPTPGSLVNASGTGSATGQSVTGGVQLGHLWQSGSFVYGVEADLGLMNLGMSRRATGAYAAPFLGSSYTVTSSLDTDWVFTARGRFGWAMGSILAYVTGGFAVTRLDHNWSLSDTNFTFGAAGTGAAGASETKLGWTLGAGLEFALGPQWSIRAEYLFLDFGSINANGQANHPGLAAGAPGFSYANGVSTSADLTAHVARIGINYRL